MKPEIKLRFNFDYIGLALLSMALKDGIISDEVMLSHPEQELTFDGLKDQIVITLIPCAETASEK